MSLTLRCTGLSSPAYREWLDYVIVEHGRAIGRLYEDRHSKPELRWFWSITVYVNPMLGIVTNGRVGTIEQAKAQFMASWEKCRTGSAAHSGDGDSHSDGSTLNAPTRRMPRR